MFGRQLQQFSLRLIILYWNRLIVGIVGHVFRHGHAPYFHIDQAAIFQALDKTHKFIP